MRRSKPKGRFRVVAIISAYNEGDIISPVIGHLVENGVHVYLLDNQSTDDTVKQAEPWLGRGLLRIEKFPEALPPKGASLPFNWGAILKRKEELAQQLKADWFIHHDADEIREGPWPGMPLTEAIRWVDRLGYNCIDFRVLNFKPVDEGFKPGTDPAAYFTRWEEPEAFDQLQLKCWKAQPGPVSLFETGGHEVQFPDRRVFPIQFLLRHYPIRSQEHGRRKVFAERKNRFLEEERAKVWHIQYDQIEDEKHSFLGDPLQLHPFDADQVRLDLMLRNRLIRQEEASRNLREQELAQLQERFAAVEQEAVQLRGIRGDLEKDGHELVNRLAGREQDLASLENLRAELERQAAALAKDGEELSEQIADLERVGAERDGQIADLERVRAERDGQIVLLENQCLDRERHIARLERHATGLEIDRDALLDRVTQAEQEKERLEHEKERLEHEKKRLEHEKKRAEEELGAIRSSTTWRSTAPIRRLMDGIKWLVR